jgi:hypothetical protein
MGLDSMHHLCTLNSTIHPGFQFNVSKCRTPQVTFWRPSLGSSAEYSINYIENLDDSSPVEIKTIRPNRNGISYFETYDTITANLHTNGLMQIGWSADAEI